MMQVKYFQYIKNMVKIIYKFKEIKKIEFFYNQKQYIKEDL